MAPPNYERVPLAEPFEQHNRSYYSGIPSTAPPSFQSVAPLPLANVSDDAVSLWADSTEDLEAAREDTIVRLLKRVEDLETRLNNGEKEKEESNAERYYRMNQWENMTVHDKVVYVGLIFGFLGVVAWIFFMITVVVLRPRVSK